ncbi:putative transcription factor ovo-like protein 3 [Orchesella cincta]|uniref:Putative transcription factor ovo-like protein 3 n=1 Tax=Orchesella cincta TaxID=48709 RepID=A0A1D2MLA6_ORCCI|nr:putative transcription factor ovo-like protein 3 [Orchesella cincta]
MDSFQNGKETSSDEEQAKDPPPVAIASSSKSCPPLNKPSTSAAARRHAMSEEKKCPECRVVYDGQSFRPVVEVSCGHEKCCRCLCESESGCRQCPKKGKKSSSPVKALKRNIDGKVKKVKVRPVEHDCPYCPMSFEYPNDLELHRTIHAAHPYRCCICSTAFFTKELLENHIVRVHYEPAQYAREIASLAVMQFLEQHVGNLEDQGSSESETTANDEKEEVVDDDEDSD